VQVAMEKDFWASCSLQKLFNAISKYLSTILMRAVCRIQRSPVFNSAEYME